MKRQLEISPGFQRAAKRLAKRDPRAASHLQTVLAALAEDAFDPALLGHKFKGALTGKFSCSAGFDLRILFSIVGDRGDAILLIDVGTHDDVY